MVLMKKNTCALVEQEVNGDVNGDVNVRQWFVSDDGEGLHKKPSNTGRKQRAT